MLVNGTIERQSGAHTYFDRAFVQNGQRSGQAETDRADIGVWRVAKARRAAAEDFTLGQQLRVDFQADHGLILSQQFGRDSGFGEEFGHGLKRKYSREALRPDYPAALPRGNRPARTKGRNDSFNECETSKQEEGIEGVAGKRIAEERYSGGVAVQKPLERLRVGRSKGPDGQVGDEEKLRCAQQRGNREGTRGLAVADEDADHDAEAKAEVDKRHDPVETDKQIAERR